MAERRKTKAQLLDELRRSEEKFLSFAGAAPDYIILIDCQGRVLFTNRTFEGVLTEIAPLGQRIQNVTYFEVEIEVIDDDAQLLRPRMSGDADIVTEVVEDALVIPETALRYRGEQIYVETVARASRPPIEARDIEIGIVDGTKVQVLRGLEVGEQVRLQ